MRRILLVFIAIFFSNELAQAQLESTAFTATGRGGVATTFATDYQAIGINPANLGYVKSFRSPFLTIGFGEMSTTITAEPLSRKQLLSSFLDPSTTNLSFAEKEQAARDFANKSIAVNFDVMALGFSLNLPRNIGVAFSTRDRVQLFTRLGAEAADLAFMGSNSSYFPALLLSSGEVIQNPRHPAFEGNTPLTEEQQNSVALGLFDSGPGGVSEGIPVRTTSEVLEDTRISASWYREYNISIGARLFDSYNFSVYGGIGYREIRGLLVVDLESEQTASGDVGFTENYLSVASGLIDFNSFQIRSGSTIQDFLFPKGVAKGRSIDLGATFVIKRNLYLGVAMNNFGSITSGDSTYAVGEEQQLEQFSGYGLANFNVLGSQESGFAIGGEDSPIDWTLQAAQKTELPATVRFGASYEYVNTLHIGFDVVMPLNEVAGNLEEPLYAIGGDFRLNKILKISSGVNYGGNNGGTVNVPLGLAYSSGKGFYEAGIATRDILTYLINSDGSTISFASGFLRFKFGRLKE